MVHLDETLAALDDLAALFEASSEKEARLAAHREKLRQQQAAAGPKTNVKGGPAQVRKAVLARAPLDAPLDPPIGGRKEGKLARRQALLYPGLPAEKRPFGVRGLKQDIEQKTRAADVKAREVADAAKHEKVMAARHEREKKKRLAAREAKRQAAWQVAMKQRRHQSLLTKIGRVGGSGPRPIGATSAGTLSPKERYKADSETRRFWSGSPKKIKERQGARESAKYDGWDRAEKREIARDRATTAKQSHSAKGLPRSPDAKPRTAIQQQKRRAAGAERHDDWEPDERGDSGKYRNKGRRSQGWRHEEFAMNINLVEEFQTRTLPAIMEVQGLVEERNETTFKSCAGKDEVKGGSMVATPHGRASIPQDRFAKQRPDGHSTYPTRPRCRASLAGVVRMAQYHGETLPLAKVNKLGGVKGGARITAASKGSRDEKHRGPSGKPKRHPNYGQPTGEKDKSLHTKDSEHGRAGNREITPVTGHAAQKPGQPMSGRKAGRKAAGVKVGVERSAALRQVANRQARQER